VGSKDEPAGRSGFAHLFEHLMFMGTDGVPYPQFDVTMERGGGWNNASTSEDRTNYFDSGPSRLLGTLLLLEADRMASLGDSMTREKLDAQRDVVRNERRQSYENRPYGMAFLELSHLLYPEGHPYREPVIGSHEDLERASVEDVREFFRRFYVPANASLVVAGDFDREATLREVERVFGAVPAKPPLQERRAPIPVIIKKPVRAEFRDAVEIPLLLSVWPSPAAHAEGDADMDVVASVLGGGKASRLYRSLVHEKRVAQDVSAYQDSRALGSEFHVTVHARPDASLEDIEAEVDLEIARLVADGPTQREVERARNKIETSFWERLQGLHERADILNAYLFHYGDPGAIRKDRERYERVTPESARAWGAKVLRPEGRVLVRVVPEESGREGNAGGEDERGKGDGGEDDEG
jgi:predicted Zn-dependent peptidase